MIKRIAALFLGPMAWKIQAGFILGGLALFSSLFLLRDESLKRRGEARMAARLERADNAVTQNIRKADANSRNASAGRLLGSIRDPNAVSE